MAKKINLKAEKAKRNQEYALQFKKKKKRGRGAGGAPRPSVSVTFAPPTPRDEHEVTCHACGSPTTVPFKPVNGKPVFCRPCFEKAG